MSKKTAPPPPRPAPPGEFSFYAIRLSGGDATLQQGIAAIHDVLRRMNAAPAPAPNGATLYPPAGAVAGLPDHTAAHPNGDAELANEIEGEVVEAAVATEELETPAAPKKSYPPASPDVIDLDLVKHEVPLKEFLQKYPQEETIKRYLLIAWWMKQYLKLDEVSMHHIHTGFRHMGSWTTPKDADQPLRHMKSKKVQWFNKGEKPKHYKLNHIGENVVIEIMKPKS